MSRGNARAGEQHVPQPQNDSARLDDLAGVIRLRGSIRREDVEDLCAEARRAIAALTVTEIGCDVADAKPAQLPTVDVLARVALEGRRRRVAVHLENPSPELLGLLRLCGLIEIVGDGAEPASRVEVGG